MSKSTRIYIVTFDSLGGCEADVLTSRNVRAYKSWEKAQEVAKSLTALVQQHSEAETEWGRAINERLPFDVRDSHRQRMRTLLAKIREIDTDLHETSSFAGEDSYGVTAVDLF